MKKYAVCSVINQRYAKYLEVFLFSLIKHNPKFNRDYIIFHKKDDLSEIDCERLKSIYSGCVFKEIKTENYNNINSGNLEQQKILWNSSHRRSLFEWTYYRLEMFNLKDYEQVIYFDIDMLVLGNLDSLFEQKYDDGIMATEDELIKSIKSPEEYDRDHKVQGGMIVVGKKMMNELVYKDLIGLLSEAYRFKMNDQSMFTEYFSDKLKRVDIKYNCGRKLYQRGRKDALVIHYAGSKKPWNAHKLSTPYTCPSFRLWERDSKEVVDFLKLKKVTQYKG